MVRNATVNQARALRRRQTTTEDLLWKQLRDRRLSHLKFRRQVPIGSYVIDFLCFRHRLIVEADGPFHDPARDAERDAWLTAQGFKVLRFSNNEAGSPAAIGRIIEAVGTPPLISDFPETPHPSASPTPSPARGEGAQSYGAAPGRT